MNEFAKSTDGEYIILNVPYAEVYIPYDVYNDSPDKGGNPVAYAYGEGVRSTGLFNIRFFYNEDENRESNKLRTFNYPNVITMYPSDKEIKTMKLESDMEEDKYIIFKFYKGDIIMSTKIQKDSKNCEAFMKQLISGKLPKGLNYTDLYYAWMKNFQINGINPGVPAITLQIIISENCRSKNNPMLQFRKVVSDKGVGLTDYKVHNMVDICSNSSVFNALTFERYADMLTTSINMTMEGTKQNTTPLEQVLYM